MKQIKQQIAAGVEIEAVDALAHDAQAADAQHGHALHEQSANDGGVDFLLGAEDGFEIGTTDAMPAVGDMASRLCGSAPKDTVLSDLHSLRRRPIPSK